jgi:hypothetical protein
MLKKQNKIGFRDTHHCTPWVHVAFTFSAVNMFWVFVFFGGRREEEEKNKMENNPLQKGQEQQTKYREGTTLQQMFWVFLQPFK